MLFQRSLKAQKANKKGCQRIIAKAGDFALVIDAAPFLDYAADLVSFDGGVPAISPDFQSFRQDIMGNISWKMISR